MTFAIGHKIPNEGGLQLRQIGSIVESNEFDVGTDQRSQPRAFAESFDIEGHGDASRCFAPLDLAQMAATPQPRQPRKLLKGEAELTSYFGKGCHAPKFAHAEHLDKSNVRHDRTDRCAVCSHIPNMAAKPRKARHDLYEIYRAKSGWFLAAWRDHAGLTLEDLADELGMSKGYVSDLETGATRENRPPTRFNRDLVEKAAKAVGTTGGRLIDLNPFQLSERLERLNAAVALLDDAGQDAMLEMAERWLGRTGTDG